MFWKDLAEGQHAFVCWQIFKQKKNFKMKFKFPFLSNCFFFQSYIPFINKKIILFHYSNFYYFSILHQFLNSISNKLYFINYILIRKNKLLIKITPLNVPLLWSIHNFPSSDSSKQCFSPSHNWVTSMHFNLSLQAYLPLFRVQFVKSIIWWSVKVYRRVSIFKRNI